MAERAIGAVAGAAGEIVMFPGTRMAMLQHRGDPASMDDSVRRFVAWRRAAHLPPHLPPHVAATYA
jgi:DNA gyrase inhibitor GyrI